MIGASRFELPVSTTYISCGALLGIGAVTGQGDTSTVGKVLGSWVMPLGFLLGAGSFWALRFA